MEPFTLSIDESDITDLHTRLDRTRWPEQLPGTAAWDKGMPVAQAREWAHDLSNVDWRGLQDELNALPQWTSVIDGQRVHFVHVRSARSDAVPVLLLHGWPGTVVELIDLVEPLSQPSSDADPAFHVVIPSHPGTGLSGPVTEPGWGAQRIARAYARLMADLGYDDYLVQGGDQGAVIAPELGRVDATHVRGIHVNAASLGFIPMGPVDSETWAALTPLEQRRLEEISTFMSSGLGYNVIQATRPQTIGFGLEDSPAAQLTWILDKVHEWTHDVDRLAGGHYRDRHLANVLLFWLSRTATSAADTIYAGNAALMSESEAPANSGVPTGVIAFASDVSIRRFAEQHHTIVRWTDRDTGGHFAALEQPEALVEDLRAFAGQVMSA